MRCLKNSVLVVFSLALCLAACDDGGKTSSSSGDHTPDTTSELVGTWKGKATQNGQEVDIVFTFSDKAPYEMTVKAGANTATLYWACVSSSYGIGVVYCYTSELKETLDSSFSYTRIADDTFRFLGSVKAYFNSDMQYAFYLLNGTFTKQA